MVTFNTQTLLHLPKPFLLHCFFRLIDRLNHFLSFARFLGFVSPFCVQIVTRIPQALLALTQPGMVTSSYLILTMMREGFIYFHLED